MKSMKVPVLIDYSTVLRRYRALLHKLALTPLLLAGLSFILS
jgi:hypothetical protein